MGILAAYRKDLNDRYITLYNHGRVLGEKMLWNVEVSYMSKMSGIQVNFVLAGVRGNMIWESVGYLYDAGKGVLGVG
jgi:hypothetical protein